jgi:hypothetical protein
MVGAPMYQFRTMVVDAEAMLEEVVHLNEMDGRFKPGRTCGAHGSAASQAD